MGEPDDGWVSDEPSPAEAAAASEARKKNDATVALTEEEFVAMQVPAAAPPRVPTPKPASRNDASMWAGSVLVADEFEPLVVPRKPLGRWVFLALFTTGLVGAALYFLWWQPAQESAASEPAADETVAAKPAEPQPAAAPAPAPVPAAETPPAPEPAPTTVAAVAPDKPAAAPPPVKKTSSSSKKKSSKKKTSSKKKSSKKKTSKKKSSRKTSSSRGG
jgi:hypothetical protein